MSEDELPEGWTSAPLKEIVDNHDGRRIPVKSTDRANRKGAYPYYGASGVIDTIDDYLFDGDFLLIAEDGANLLSRSTPIAFPASGKFWVNNHAHIVQTRGGMPLGYLEHYLNSFDLQQIVTGTAQPKLTQAALNDIGVPIPPLPEQHRIVEKVESLLADVNASRDRLARVLPILKRFRQAVLAAACSGRLTEEWRDARPSDGSIPELLRDAASFVETQTYVRRRLDAATAERAADQDVPEGWACVPLRSLAVILSGQTAKGIDALVTPTGKYAWFKVGDMNTTGNERYMRNADAWLTESATASLGLRPLPTGAVIFPKRGGAISTNKKRVLVKDSCVDLNTMAFIPYPPIADYLWWWFATVDLGSLSDGSNVPQINHPDIEPLNVTLPPIEEQAEIVLRVEALFALGDAVEARVKAATATANKLPQAILSKAFRGELVPTEAELALAEGRTYETAAEMLARVKAAQDKKPTGKKLKGRAAARKRA
jgi:type I restriction enzyme S subunit